MGYVRGIGLKEQQFWQVASRNYSTIRYFIMHANHGGR